MPPGANDFPLSVALVRQKYTPYGGAERFVERAMGALDARRVAVTVVTRRWPEGAHAAALICNPFHIGSLWRDWSFARCVCHALERHGFDLVQSHERISCCDVYRAGDGVHAEWLAQRKRVIGPMGRLSVAINPYHRHTVAAERRMFEGPRLKAVICNSRMVRDEILARFAIAPEKLHVIYGGVDTEAFHPRAAEQRGATRQRLGIPALAPVFAFVGSGFERKGLATLLTALAQVADAHAVVVGRDKHEARFRALARRLGVAGRVHFLGGRTDVRPYYGAADALVLPTLYDPFPNVALEAMACGLPVATSLKCGAAELLREGETGFLRDALDVPGFVAALQALADRKRAQTMGRAARAAVEPWTLAAMAERLAGFYAQILQRGREG